MFEEKGKRYGLFFFLQKMIFFEEPAKLRSGDPVPSLHRTLTSAKNRHVFGCGRRALSVLLVSKETYASVKRDLLTRLSFLPSGRRALSVLLSRHCCAPRYATCATVAALGLEVLRSKQKKLRDSYDRAKKEGMVSFLPSGIALLPSVKRDLH